MGTIRLAEARDYGRILEIEQSINRKNTAAAPDLFRIADDLIPLWAYEKDIAAGNVLVYKLQEETIGFARVGVHEIKDAAMVVQRVLFIYTIGFLPEHTGKGYGRKLIAELEKLGRKRGCSNVELNVWAHNPKARDFYERQGMAAKYTVMRKPIP